MIGCSRPDASIDAASSVQAGLRRMRCVGWKGLGRMLSTGELPQRARRLRLLAGHRPEQCFEPASEALGLAHVMRLRERCGGSAAVLSTTAREARARRISSCADREVALGPDRLHVVQQDRLAEARRLREPHVPGNRRIEDFAAEIFLRILRPPGGRGSAANRTWSAARR